MNRIRTFFTQKWLITFIIGIILFFATEQALKYTSNLNLFPAVLLLGAMVIPITFVVYIYERERKQDREIHRVSPLGIAAITFGIGGIIGIIAAGVLEYQTLSGLNVLGLVGVGFIEEAVKLILPVIIFVIGRYRSEIDGILIGVATGMGFASLETMGYGLVTFLRSTGDINLLEQVLLVRGLLSPVGHAAWTGFICAVMWRERLKRGTVSFVFRVIGAFLLAVLLHFLWDLSNFIGATSTASALFGLLGTLAIAAISLILLILILRESKKYSGTPDAA